MLDASHAMALVGSLKTAGEMISALIGIRDAAVLQSKIIELNGVILSAQSSALASNQDQFALLDRVRQLEKEITDLETWNAEKKRYELKKIGRGIIAFLLKKEASDGEPSHAVCSNCYQKQSISPLQFNGKAVVHDQSYDCPSCKTSFRIMRAEMEAALAA